MARQRTLFSLLLFLASCALLWQRGCATAERVAWMYPAGDYPVGDPRSVGGEQLDLAAVDADREPEFAIYASIPADASELRVGVYVYGLTDASDVVEAITARLGDEDPADLGSPPYGEFEWNYATISLANRSCTAADGPLTLHLRVVTDTDVVWLGGRSNHPVALPLACVDGRLHVSEAAAEERERAGEGCRASSFYWRDLAGLDRGLDVVQWATLAPAVCGRPATDYLELEAGRVLRDAWRAPRWLAAAELATHRLNLQLNRAPANESMDALAAELEVHLQATCEASADSRAAHATVRMAAALFIHNVDAELRCHPTDDALYVATVISEVRTATVDFERGLTDFLWEADAYGRLTDTPSAAAYAYGGLLAFLGLVLLCVLLCAVGHCLIACRKRRRALVI